jgi:hypothetical protein
MESEKVRNTGGTMPEELKPCPECLILTEGLESIIRYIQLMEDVDVRQETEEYAKSLLESWNKRDTP